MLYPIELQTDMAEGKRIELFTRGFGDLIATLEHSPLLEPPKGLEPLQPALEALCSSIELRRSGATSSS